MLLICGLVLLRNRNITAALQGVDDVNEGLGRKSGAHQADDDQHDHTENGVDSQEKIQGLHLAVKNGIRNVYADLQATGGDGPAQGLVIGFCVRQVAVKEGTV